MKYRFECTAPDHEDREFYAPSPSSAAALYYCECQGETTEWWKYETFQVTVVRLDHSWTVDISIELSKGIE